MKQLTKYFIALGIWITLASTTANAQTTEFVYQGQLQNSSAPANGNFDFEFLLFDSLAGPNQIGSTLTRPGVAVTNGTFSVKLDFGASFPGASRFVEIHVKQTGGGAFTPLTPRQPVSNTPYAVKSLTADTATNATNATTAATATNSSQLNGQTGSFYQNAANLSSGTIPDLRLSSNVALLNTVQTFSAAKTFSAASVFNSTVGIGTASPQRALSIVGGLVVDQSNQNTTSNGFGITFGSFSGEGISSNRGAGANPNGLDFFAGSGTVPKMSLTNTGSFGIGTSSPQRTLSVAGGLVVDQGNQNRTSNGFGISFGAFSGEGISSNRGTGANPSGLDFFAGSNTTPRVSLTNSGDFGIGTTSPGARLDVQVASGQSFQFRQDSGLVPGINVNSTGGNAGVMRLRNSMEIWPSDDASRAGRLDVRNTAGSPTISLDGQTGSIGARNMPGVAFDVPASPLEDGNPVIVDMNQFSTIKTITVNVPANGFLVLYGCVYVITRSSAIPPTISIGRLDLFDETSNTTVATAYFSGPAHTVPVQTVLAVSAGSRTLSLKIKAGSLDGNDLIYWDNTGNVTAMFFPVRY